jgi:hypothetical protein
MQMTAECLRGTEWSKRLWESLADILVIFFRTKTGDRRGQNQLLLVHRALRFYIQPFPYTALRALSKDFLYLLLLLAPLQFVQYVSPHQVQFGRIMKEGQNIHGTDLSLLK